MVLRLTPAPMIAAGVSNFITADLQEVVLAATAPVTTVQLGAGIDDVSLSLAAHYTVRGAAAQVVGAQGTEFLAEGGQFLALQSWMYMIWDNWLFNFFPLI